MGEIGSNLCWIGLGKGADGVYSYIITVICTQSIKDMYMSVRMYGYPKMNRIIQFLCLGEMKEIVNFFLDMKGKGFGFGLMTVVPLRIFSIVA